MDIRKDIKLTTCDIITVSCVIILSTLLPDLVILKKEIQNEANLLNNTHDANQSFVIFNRVPKAGSETLWKLLDKLAKRNNFTSYSDDQELKKKRGYENTLMPMLEQLNYVNIFKDPVTYNASFPCSYIKHINFINFEHFNYTNPIYINMVRDPIERIFSWYYYIRQSHYQLEFDKERNATKLVARLLPIQLKLTYEECYRGGWEECKYPVGLASHKGPWGGSHYSQIAFYCGMHPECNVFGSRQGLEMAKNNVEKYYAVVGILERWDDSLHVFEHYVPAFFKGVTQIYKALKVKQTNKTGFKPRLPANIRKELMTNFTMEMEFYQFCRQRFQRQFLAIQ